jgi:hypothetical protein
MVSSEEEIMAEVNIDISKLDHPVIRLYGIISKARKTPAEVASRYAWADAFGVPRDNLMLIYTSLVDLSKLVKIAKLTIEELDDVNKEYYLKPIHVVETILANPNLEQQWGPSKGQLDDVTMLAFQMASNTMSIGVKNEIISEEKLGNIQKEVEKIIEKIIPEDIGSKDLKMLLINHLEIIRRSIINYRITGADGLKEAIANSIGLLFIEKENIKENIGNHEKRRIIWKEFLDILANLSQLASLGIQIGQLSTIIPPLLKSG